MSQHLKIIIKLKCLLVQIIFISCQSSCGNYGYSDYSAYSYPPGAVEAAGLQCSLQQIYNTYYSGYSLTPTTSYGYNDYHTPYLAYGYNDYQTQKNTEPVPSCESQFPPRMTQQIIIVNENDDDDKDFSAGELLSMLIALKDDVDDDEPMMYPYPVPYPVPCCCECSDDCGKCRYHESDFADFDFMCESRGNRQSDCGHCSKKRKSSAERHHGKSTCKHTRGSSYEKIAHLLLNPDCDEGSCGCTSTKINLSSKKRSSCRSRDYDCESSSRKYEY